MRRVAPPLSILLLCAALLAPAACDRAPAAGKEKANVAAAAAPDTVPHRFVRNLVGTAGDDRVEAWLRREGELLSGTWSADGEERWLSGTIAASGALAVPIYSEEGDSIGFLDGTIIAGPEGLSLSGRLLTGGDAVAVALMEERIMLAEGVRLMPREWLEEDAEFGWSLHAEIPTAESADGAPLAPAFAAFNAAVDSMVRASAATFQEAVLEDVQAAVDGEYAPEGASSWESSYEVAVAEEGIVSILFDVSDYYAGAAHPNHYTWALTWDMDAGRPVPLDALFLSGSPYLQRLSEYVIPELERALGPDVDAAWIAEGAGPAPDNFASWTITPEGLRIVFDPYQVAPYAAGPQEVLVRWSAIEPLLDPAGPVARIHR